MYSLVFIGCGNLGGAILASIINNNVLNPRDILCILPPNSPDVQKLKVQFGVNCIDTIPKLIETKAVMIAVKPQILSEIADQYVNVFTNDTLIMSIVAGKTLHYYQKYFPNNPIIRLMPNINLVKNTGVTIALPTSNVSAQQMELCSAIFAPTGVFEWVSDEKMMDLVIPIAASAPAFYCYMCELIIELGVQNGVSHEVSRELAQYALAGTGEFLKDLSVSPADVRAMVTSYKGTTQAALDAFNENDALRILMKKAFDAAIKRSQELAE